MLSIVLFVFSYVPHITVNLRAWRKRPETWKQNTVALVEDIQKWQSWMTKELDRTSWSMLLSLVVVVAFALSDFVILSMVSGRRGERRNC